MPSRWRLLWGRAEMGRPINLLRWREKRRRECLRFWILLFVGAWLVALASIAAVRAVERPLQQWQALWQENDRAVYQSLIQREQLLREEQQRRRQRQALEQKRDATRRWQPRLLVIAERMPEEAWLTALQWQGETLSISGLANRFAALAEFDAALRQLPDFRRVEPGAVHRDREGRWQFSYRLLMEVDDVSLR